MVKNGKPTSERISDEIYSTPLVQPQKITKVTKKSAKPTKKSVRVFTNFSLFLKFFLWCFAGTNLWITRRNVPDTNQKVIFMKMTTVNTTNKKRSYNSSQLLLYLLHESQFYLFSLMTLVMKKKICCNRYYKEVYLWRNRKQ